MKNKSVFMSLYEKTLNEAPESNLVTDQDIADHTADPSNVRYFDSSRGNVDVMSANDKGKYRQKLNKPKSKQILKDAGINKPSELTPGTVWETTRNMVTILKNETRREQRYHNGSMQDDPAGATRRWINYKTVSKATGKESEHETTFDNLMNRGIVKVHEVGTGEVGKAPKIDKPKDSEAIKFLNDIAEEIDNNTNYPGITGLWNIDPYDGDSGAGFEFELDDVTFYVDLEDGPGKPMIFAMSKETDKKIYVDPSEMGYVEASKYIHEQLRNKATSTDVSDQLVGSSDTVKQDAVDGAAKTGAKPNSLEELHEMERFAVDQLKKNGNNMQAAMWDDEMRTVFQYLVQRGIVEIKPHSKFKDVDAYWLVD